MAEYDPQQVREITEPIAVAESTDRAETVATLIQKFEPHEFTLDEAIHHLKKVVNLSDEERAYVSNHAPFPCVAREWEMCNFLEATADMKGKKIEISGSIYPVTDGRSLFGQIQEQRNW